VAIVVEGIEGDIDMARQEWAYGIPFLGGVISGYDKWKDFKSMDRDYQKNTGRYYKYPTQGYNAMAGNIARSTLDTVISAGFRTARSASRASSRGNYGTTRSVMDI
jgi:hypothetical protein